jgi:hypothetical protein
MRRAGLFVGVGLVLASAGCELQEITLVDAEDVVIAEVHVQIGEGLFGANRVTAFLHRTVGGLGPGYQPVPGARVVIGRQDGGSAEMAATALENCVRTTPIDATGSCYWLAPSVAAGFRPGEALELTITLQGGGVLRSATDVPGDFEVRGVEEGGRCSLPPSTPLTVRWTPSAGAWAYVNETSIFGLRDALAPIEVSAEEDPLHLLGLSISAADTTIVFPGEFGVFHRFELDQAIATTLQKGMPEGTHAPVTIAAADRNYVNWVRGGNFNPSGQVRVPSVRGAGTGVFASTVVRSFEVVVDPDSTGASYGAPACPIS